MQTSYSKNANKCTLTTYFRQEYNACTRQIEAEKYSRYSFPYNQIEAQLLDDSSELYTFCPAAVLICMCTEKLYETFCSLPQAQRSSFADTTFERVNRYWKLINTHIETNILQFTFIEVDDRTFGNFAGKMICPRFMVQEQC